jgi:hypothetical protein
VSKLASRNGKAKVAELPPDKVHTPHGQVMDKIDVYGWEILDKSGRYQKISKTQLNVDHDYQRDNVKNARVIRIASKWQWSRFGTISVALRPDGTFWVFDGQHRKLAADKRSDIDLLPCMVFTSTGPVAEAGWFLAQTDRGNLTMLDRFKALVTQNDPTAIAARDMIAASGYKIAYSSGTKTVRCISAIMQCVRTDPDAAQVAWDMAVAISDGENIADVVFWGLFVVERHLARLSLGSIADAKIRPFVTRLTTRAILRSVAETAAYFGKGGQKVYGESVLRLMNKGRQHKIPSLYAERTEDATDVA